MSSVQPLWPCLGAVAEGLRFQWLRVLYSWSPPGISKSRPSLIGAFPHVGMPGCRIRQVLWRRHNARERERPTMGIPFILPPGPAFVLLAVCSSPALPLPALFVDESGTSGIRTMGTRDTRSTRAVGNRSGTVGRDDLISDPFGRVVCLPQ